MTSAPAALRTLDALAFDNSYARLPDAFGARVAPTPLANPRLLHFNADVAALLDLDPAEAARPDAPALLSGGRALPGSEPFAMAYAGHQFGTLVPQLGDGRAILLGEVVNALGERWDLHLKGSGPTPFSRGFDGRAVLRSSVREYLAGEALHHLGVPSTRALALVAADDPVRREREERAAAILRVAPSHVRLGTFEWFYYRDDTEGLRRLADYVIARHLPELEGRPDRYPRLLREASERTARLVAAWQAVGFTHGVLNTDNMSIIGVTIDFGPYGFLDAFASGYIPNHSDPGGRYAYDQQPAIGQWNVAALAQAMLPLMTREDALAGLDAYVPAFADAYGGRMRAKLGLRAARADDEALVGDLLALMEAEGADFTLTFRALAGIGAADGTDRRNLAAGFRDRARCDAWLARYRARLAAEGGADDERAARMDAVNPLYVLRTWIAQQVIADAERGGTAELDRVLAMLRAPFTERPGLEAYAAPPPEWARGLVLSCSS